MKKNKLMILLTGLLCITVVANSVGVIDVLAAPKKEESEAVSENESSAENEAETDDETKADTEAETEDSDEKETSYVVDISDDQKTVIHIKSVDDLILLSENCRVDSWSVDKKVVLDDNLNLAGTDMKTIPIFCGEFDGNGHQISGVYYSGDGYVTGLFRYLGKGAVVKDLYVDGAVIAEGDQRITGLLCGVNSGTITGCNVTGVVEGKTATGGVCGVNTSGGVIENTDNSCNVIGYYYTGGIAGKNYGLIEDCINNGNVNDTFEWVTTDDAMNADFLDELTGKSETMIQSGIDTGGVAGYSMGSIVKCTNKATVGYAHSGYNVGGIAGRQCGLIDSSENRGNVYGKKDVGGITGQMEPYINPNDQESIVDQVDKLKDMMANAVNDADELSASVNRDMNSLQSDMDKAEEIMGRISTRGSVATIDVPDVSSVESAAENAANKAEEEAQNVDNQIKENLDKESIDVNTDEIKANLENAENKLNNGSAAGAVQVTEDTLNDLNELSEVFKRMSETSRNLINHTEEYSRKLSKDMNEINEQINLISHMVDEKTDELADKGTQYFYEDISESSIEDASLGVVTGCTNRGIIKADINVGGIAGTMNIDEEDPEGNVVSKMEKEVGGRYFYTNIVKECYNRGFITAKNDKAGGIVGNMGQGVVYKCYGFGGVESKEGNYVGGIAGSSESAIRSSYVLATIAGKAYVGGICGYGNKISYCYSMPTITRYESRYGTVAGNITITEDTNELNLDNLEHNYYVSDYFYGIDGVSYGNKAEAVSYENLLKMDDLPIEYRYLTVSFKTEDEFIKSISMHYGDDLTNLEYPEIPKKEGYYGTWPELAVDTLQGNLIIEAEYKDTITVVESEEFSDYTYVPPKEDLIPRIMGMLKFNKDESDESLTVHLTKKANGYVDGTWDDMTVLNASSVEDGDITLQGLPGGTDHRIYHVTLNVDDKDLEDGDRLRLYAPMEDYQVFKFDGEKWQEVECLERGDYADVALDSTDGYYAVAVRPVDYRKYYVYGANAVLVIVGIIAVSIVAKGKKKRALKKED